QIISHMCRCNHNVRVTRQFKKTAHIADAMLFLQGRRGSKNNASRPIDIPNDCQLDGHWIKSPLDRLNTRIKGAHINAQDIVSRIIGIIQGIHLILEHLFYYYTPMIEYYQWKFMS